MGSSASYRAGVTLVTKRTLKIDTVNTAEDIQKFLKKKKGVFEKVIDLKGEEPSEDKLKDGTYSRYMFKTSEWNNELNNNYSDEYSSFEEFLEESYDAVNEEIYCDNDNSFETRLKLSKKQLEDLASGKAYLKFYGDGWTYC